jgi:hypothetical protein
MADSNEKFSPSFRLAPQVVVEAMFSNSRDLCAPGSRPGARFRQSKYV